MGFPFPNVDPAVQGNLDATPKAAEPSLRFIRGIVNSDGSIASGSGFTIDKAGTTYTINFTPPFYDFPSVQPTANDGNTATLTNLTQDHASVTTTGSAFNFIVMGLDGPING